MGKEKIINRKYEFLNYLDNSIADAFESAVLMYSFDNVGYYQFLQRYCELIIKDIILTYGYEDEVDKKTTLGILIGSEKIKDLLIIKLGIDEDILEDISIINQTSNTLKHNNEEVDFHNFVAVREFNSCFIIAKKYLQIFKECSIGNFNINGTNILQPAKLEQEEKNINKNYNNTNVTNNIIEDSAYEKAKAESIEQKQLLLIKCIDSVKTENSEKLYNKDVFIGLDSEDNVLVSRESIEKLLTVYAEILKNNKAYYSMEASEYGEMLIYLIKTIIESPKKTGREYTKFLIGEGIKVLNSQINSLLYSANTLFYPTYDINGKPSWELNENAYNLLMILNQK